MTSQQIAHEGVQVTLVSAGNYPALAAHTLAQHFGLRLEETEALLANGRGVIAHQVRETDARTVQPVLMALGLQIDIRPLGTRTEPEIYEVSLRLTAPQATADLHVELERLGEATSDEFPGPSGLVLGGLTRGRADALRTLQRIDGVDVTISARSEARYDLFPRQAGAGGISAPLLRHLSLIGCRGDRTTSALAVDLDQRCMTHVLARFPDAGLIGVNQAFQRYDLSLTGTGRLTRREMRDFLVTRGAHSPDLVDALAAGEPLRLERGLARMATRQFLADYATIGIPARADLIRA